MKLGVSACFIKVCLTGSFARPSVMRRASCMGSQKWQILPFILPLHFPVSLFTPQLSLSPLTFHLSPSLSPLIFYLSALTFLSFHPTLTFPSHFSPFHSHFPLSLFTLQLSPPPLIFSPFNSHFSPVTLRYNRVITMHFQKTQLSGTIRISS